MKLKYTLERIVWIDAMNIAGWDAKPELAEIVTVGFVVVDTDTLVGVSTTVSAVPTEDDYCGIHCIPKTWIKSRDSLAINE